MKTNLTLDHPVNENLFRLIQSLEKSEKRHVKMWLKSTYKKEEQRYTFLFDYLDRQKKYSEEALIKRLQGLYNISRHQVATTKYLLYHIILRSLRNLYANHHPGFKVREGLDIVEVLFDKALYTQSYRILERMKQLVIQEELSNFLPLILEWENRIAPFLAPYYNEVDVRELYKSTQQVSAQFDWAWQMQKQFAKTELLKHQDLSSISEEEQRQMQSAIQELTVEMNSLPQPAISQRLRRHQVANRYAQWWGAPSQEEEVEVALAELPSPQQIPMAQIGEVQKGLLELLCSVSDDVTLEKSATYLNEIPVPPGQEPAQELAQALLRWHRSICSSQQGNTALLEQFETDVQPHSLAVLGGALSCEWQLRLAIDLWMVGFPQKAMKMLNQLAQLHKHPLGTYHSDRVRLISLLVLYDLEDYSVGEYLLRSTERAFQNREYNVSAFSSMLKVLKKLFLSYSPKEKALYINQLLSTVAEGEYPRLHDVYWGMGVFRLWALAKQSSSSLLDVFRKHALSNQTIERQLLQNTKVAS